MKRFNLRDKVYFIWNNLIAEGIVVGIREFIKDAFNYLNLNNDTAIRYEVIFTPAKGDDKQTTLDGHLCFGSIEEILTFLETSVIFTEEERALEDERKRKELLTFN